MQHKSLAVNSTEATCGSTRGSLVVNSLRPVPASDGRRLPKPGIDAMMRDAQGGTTVEKQPNSRMCFVCGIDNPIGLHLAFYTDDEGRCIARFQPRPHHQGYPGQLHGGLISTILDLGETRSRERSVEKQALSQRTMPNGTRITRLADAWRASPPESHLQCAWSGQIRARLAKSGSCGR